MQQSGRLLVLLALLAACGAEDDSGSSGGEETGLPAELGSCADGTALTWTEAGPIFGQRCAGCHSSALAGADRQGAPAPINYDTPEDAVVNAFVTWGSISSGAMPLPDAAALPAAEAAEIWEWLSCGGPQ